MTCVAKSGTCREARQRQGHGSVYGAAFFEPASLPAHLSQPLLRLTPDNRLTFSTLESNTSAPLVRAVHKKKEMVTKLWYPCYILTNYWTFSSFTVNKFLIIILLGMFFLIRIKPCWLNWYCFFNRNKYVQRSTQDFIFGVSYLNCEVMMYPSRNSWGILPQEDF